MARITVLMGHYGSGKTEISLQMALESAKQGISTGLVDLDIVNPYFRSGEQEALLRAHDIDVVMPVYEGSAVDVPSLPPEVRRIFADSDRHYFVDAGGETGGAAVLGSYARLLQKEDVAAYAVVNTCRPWTDTVEHITDMIRKLAYVSRLPVTGLIHNTNLARLTTPDMLVKGQKLVEEAAEQLNLPVSAIYGMPEVLEGLPSSFKQNYADRLHSLTLRMRPDWLDETF